MEICIDTLESARNAVNGGASRLEVCSALTEGGLTPTPGFVKLLKTMTVPLYVMIRVRAGNFVYTREEMDAMLHDVRVLRDLDVDGFVFGALTPDAEVDVKFCEEVIAAARPRPVTFHRAFDETSKPLEALEILIDLGFERILTSGQKNSAAEGLALIKRLVDGSRGRIVIMPGGGITKDNLSLIKSDSGAREFHASAKRRKIESGTKLRMGAESDSRCIMVADEEMVREMVDIAKNFG